jgi:hypothetical protein
LFYCFGGSGMKSGRQRFQFSPVGLVCLTVF